MICFNLTLHMFISSIVGFKNCFKCIKGLEKKNERRHESEHCQEHQTNRSDQFNREWETVPA